MNHALLGAPEPPRTAHEWVDFTIEHAALQGPGGVALGALLSAVGLDAPALAPQRRAVARVPESGARGARAAAGRRRGPEAERLRASALSELQQRLRAREDQSKRGRGAAAESQALDKLCLDGLASKRLRTRTDVTANKTSKHAALGDAHASIATFDPGADACRGGAGGAVAFCDAWARLKDGGAVARVQARVPGATPDLGACKTAAALEHCKRANRLFGFPLCFFVGNVSRGDGAPRELWDAVSADQQRRVAHVLATLRRVAIVDRSALLVSLVRRTNAINAGRKVDGKTWRRLVDRMVDRGDAAAGELACDGEADPVAVLYLPSAAIPCLWAPPQAAEFRAAPRRAGRKRRREKRARKPRRRSCPWRRRRSRRATTSPASR
ncbi:hypothetical protein JL721_9145 [Aureococcus anophagefferens]|nr:hypothetical protein JL721_9145 [Aureococcus anophagefferens]